MKNLVGFGHDIHRLVKGCKLVLGGIEIRHDKGSLAHSDGDVVLHALIDAILGASAMGDIGELFPDTDPKYKNISSAILLKETLQLLKKQKFTLGNIDITIICDKPKLLNYKKLMKKKIAEILRLPTYSVNIKAKTNEGMGELGKNKAIAAYAAVILNKN